MTQKYISCCETRPVLQNFAYEGSKVRETDRSHNSWSPPECHLHNLPELHTNELWSYGDDEEDKSTKRGESSIMRKPNEGPCKVGCWTFPISQCHRDDDDDDDNNNDDKMVMTSMYAFRNIAYVESYKYFLFY